MSESKFTMIELFSGIGAQERALKQLNIPYEISHTCDCEKDAVLSYAAMRYDIENEMKTFDFPSQDKMIEELQAKNLGYDFEKGKHTITSRTPLAKLKQYYIADVLSRNLGDIGKVERLPYADLVTYSFCCQDLSVAGKGEGMKLTCDQCGHSWQIDFANPETNSKCPNCGNTDIESTRSGLLGQVQRLLGIAKENDELPKYLLLENVKNLIGKKFKAQFDSWVYWLDSIGYTTYYKVLNAKKYGIPQNRERVFAISIRKDIDNGFTFPEEIPLTTCLKNILETTVDEKYYLPDERIEKILNSSFMQEKKRIQTTDVCDTLLARDWKDPKCVPVEEPSVHQIMNIMPGTNRTNPNQGRVYDTEGISPALTTMEGGNRQPFIIDEIKVIGNYMPSNHDASRVVDIDGIAPTVKENHGTVTGIAEPQIIQKFGDRGTSQYSIRDYAHTIPANPMSDRGQMVVEPQVEPFVVASRGRNPENPSDRTVGSPTEQRLEPNFSGCTNTLTSVQKDNYICEPKIIQNPHGFNVGCMREDCPSITASYFQENNYVAEPQVLRAERTEYGKEIRKQYEAGEIDEKIGNMREMKPRTDGVANTITTVQKDNYVAEPKLVGGVGEKNFGQQYRQGNRVYDSDEIAMALTAQPLGNAGGYSYLYAVEEPIIYDDYNDNISNNQDVINTLTTNCGVSTERNGVKIIEPMVCEERRDEGLRYFKDDCVDTLRTIDACGDKRVIEQTENGIRWRIRKLTPTECWRLMGFTDEDVERASKWVSNSTLYKTAGNSIVTNCLTALFSSLLIEDGHKADIWTKYQLHFNDKSGD